MALSGCKVKVFDAFAEGLPKVLEGMPSVELHRFGLWHQREEKEVEVEVPAPPGKKKKV